MVAGVRMSFNVLVDHRYLSLKTFRVNGEAVPTPVWFAQAGGKLYVTTRPESGKVKRIKQNGDIEVAPCDVRGNLLGDFVPATARIMEQDEEVNAFKALEAKYSDTDMWQNSVRGYEQGKRTFLEITNR
jgi:PPOX class probable F420-dependent enzyme